MAGGYVLWLRSVARPYQIWELAITPAESCLPNFLCLLFQEILATSGGLAQTLCLAVSTTLS